ncbi:hypothetical protein H6G32_07935 [Cylindrospermum sp. FACHB-282]|nr:hypothetical protein [Cylindrospermum sp. FACHB-282]MBD2385339.1 hypothetical protein [Cylindrospermum sp. FACHB-282]
MKVLLVQMVKVINKGLVDVITIQRRNIGRGSSACRHANCFYKFEWNYIANIA